MKRIVTGEDERVGQWVADRIGCTFNPKITSTIGLESNGRLVAGVTYHDYNRANVFMGCAGEGRYWLNREFLWFAFFYPFEQLKVNRVSVSIASRNDDSLRFCRNLGFVHEATLTDAHPTGNMEIMRMFRNECRWLEVRK